MTYSISTYTYIEERLIWEFKLRFNNLFLPYKEEFDTDI